MTRPIVAISLLMLLFSQLFIKLGVVVHWKANQAFIIAEFCENKNKPELKCNGKCHLKKQLNKVDQPASNQEQVPSNKIKLSAQEAFVVAPTPQFNPTFQVIPHIKHTYASLPIFWQSFECNYIIIQPPEVLG